MDNRKEDKKVIRVAIYCRMARDNDAGKGTQGRGNSLPDTGDKGRVSCQKK